MAKTAYLSLGSNVGDREASLQAAVALLAGPRLRILRVSPVYETEPQDFLNQGLFLNLVAEVETELFPRQLLQRAQQVEKRLGRERRVAKGPRSIDIDILLFGDFVVDAPDLVIPHPRLHLRRFALEPLSDLAPGLRHPVLRKTVRELLSGTCDQHARRVSFHLEPPK